MKFNEYATQQDQTNYFESVGMQKSDVAIAVVAMRQWAEATQQLVAALNKIPETTGHLGGSAFDSTDGSTLAAAVALELQRSKYVVQESNLVDVASQMTQFSTRVATACSQLDEEEFLG